MQVFITDPGERRSNVHDPAQIYNEEQAGYRIAFIRGIPHTIAGLTALLGAVADSYPLMVVAVAAVALGELGVRGIRRSVSRQARAFTQDMGEVRLVSVFGYVRAAVCDGHAHVWSEADDHAFSDPDRLAQAVEELEKHILSLVPDSQGLRSLSVRLDQTFLERWLDGSFESFERSSSSLLRIVAPALGERATELADSLETAAPDGRRLIEVDLFADGTIRAAWREAGAANSTESGGSESTSLGETPLQAS